jgi:hypothetical protein
MTEEKFARTIHMRKLERGLCIKVFLHESMCVGVERNFEFYTMSVCLGGQGEEERKRCSGGRSHTPRLR